MKKIVTKILRVILPEPVQIRVGLKKLRCSADPLSPLLDELARDGPLSVLEIGVRRGATLRYIARLYRVSLYIAVDPFSDYDEYRDDPFSSVLREESGDSIYAATRALGKQLLGEKFRLLRKFSSDAAASVPDSSLNFVFVDGNHSYSYVLADLRQYWDKLMPGGWMCGHDYFMRHLSAGGGYPEPMVFEAVQQFAQEMSLEVREYGLHRGFPMCFAMKKPATTGQPANS